VFCQEDEQYDVVTVSDAINSDVSQLLSQFNTDYCEKIENTFSQFTDFISNANEKDNKMHDTV